MEYKQKYVCHLKEMNFNYQVWYLASFPILLAGCGQSEEVLRRLAGPQEGRSQGFWITAWSRGTLSIIGTPESPRDSFTRSETIFITTLKKTSVILVNVTFWYCIMKLVNIWEICIIQQTNNLQMTHTCYKSSRGKKKIHSKCKTYKWILI